MVFPIGVSISDFIGGIKLLKDAVEALSDTRGACADYDELFRSLDSLDKTFNAISHFNTAAHHEAIGPIFENCKTCVTNFLVDVAKFKSLGNQKAEKRTIAARFRQVQWALCKEEDLREFRAQLETHLSALEMLLLTFQVESQMRLKNQVHTAHEGLQVVDKKIDLVREVQKESRQEISSMTRAQNQELSNMKLGIECSSSQMRVQSTTLQEIHNRLQSGLSPEEQHVMFRLLQDALKHKDRLEQQLKDLTAQNKSLETHILEIKASIKTQNEVPPQILLQRPVVLHDALGRIAPFHLEFISSIEALLAVLKIRFKNVGWKKVDLLEFELRERRHQKQIMLHAPWEIVFMPGQHVEMSMLFPDDGLSRGCCPGCAFKEARIFQEGEQIDCSECPMTYRWTRRAAGFLDFTSSDSTSRGEKEKPESISSFCRVDVVEPEKDMSKTSSTRQQRGEERENSWYCGECNDGPYGFWQTSCQSCQHSKCSTCSAKLRSI